MEEEEYEFVYDRYSKPRRVIGDNGGYVYADTGEPVELLAVIHNSKDHPELSGDTI